MTSGTSRFLDALAEFERTVRDDDIAATRTAHETLSRTSGFASPSELAQAGPRLAAILDDVPLGGQANIAVLIGRCAENGADATECCVPVLTKLIVNLGYAQGFAHAWIEKLGRPLPDADGELSDEILALGPPDVVLAWWTLDGWIRAALTFLRRPEIRLDQETRDHLITLHTELVETTGRWYQELADVLAAPSRETDVG
ncbi:hypothetical protein [Nocardia sp. BMG51109]|uniref:hypothetical protein n=1 Tax=Nocardia sp. BMG51109 TaxID=1056816 RepID=UPI0004633EB7|nr:hypothetical protein [Nocardia sp. BMG51109]